MKEGKIEIHAHFLIESVIRKAKNDRRFHTTTYICIVGLHRCKGNNSVPKTHSRGKYFMPPSGAAVSRVHIKLVMCRECGEKKNKRRQQTRAPENCRNEADERSKKKKNNKYIFEFQIVLSFWRQLPTNEKSSRRIYVHLPLICECMNDERHIQDTT